LWGARLKGSLSVDHPIAGDELCAIERYVATQTDNLPWLFVSERQAQLPARSTTSFALPVKSRSSVGFGPTCSSIPAATTLRSGSRSTDHGGPPRAPRSQTHSPLHPGCRVPFRGLWL